MRWSFSHSNEGNGLLYLVFQSVGSEEIELEENKKEKNKQKRERCRIAELAVRVMLVEFGGRFLSDQSRV